VKPSSTRTIETTFHMLKCNLIMVKVRILTAGEGLLTEDLIH
jgi:hypothetical protein